MAGTSTRNHNHYVYHFKAFCEWLFRNRFIRENPLTYVSLRPDKGDANPTRVLTIEETDRLLKLETRRTALYTFVVYTGFRWGARHDGGEAARLLWEWIDFGAGELVIPVDSVTKNRKRVRLPLASIVLDALASERRIGGRIFATVPTLKTWNRDLDLAGITRRTSEGTAHRKTTRKTFATRLAEAGVDGELRGRLLRHSDTMLVERRYTEKTPAMVRLERKAVERMVKYVQRASQTRIA